MSKELEIVSLELTVVALCGLILISETYAATGTLFCICHTSLFNIIFWVFQQLVFFFCLYPIMKKWYTEVHTSISIISNRTCCVSFWNVCHSGVISNPVWDSTWYENWNRLENWERPCKLNMNIQQTYQWITELATD